MFAPCGKPVEQVTEFSIIFMSGLSAACQSTEGYGMQWLLSINKGL